MDGILSGLEIKAAVARGDIEIDPFVPENVNPVSLDLTLGEKVAVYESWTYDSGEIGRFQGEELRPVECVLDMREEAAVRRYEISSRGFLLKPGILYLMHTRERVLARRHVPVLDGKSSIGRLGITIHLTAGFGDPGFDGQYTLEVTAVHPVLVFAGARFCQIRFHTICGEVISYQSHKSNYVGESAVGPVASRAWKMFER